MIFRDAGLLMERTPPVGLRPGLPGQEVQRDRGHQRCSNGDRPFSRDARRRSPRFRRADEGEAPEPAGVVESRRRRSGRAFAAGGAVRSAPASAPAPVAAKLLTRPRGPCGSVGGQPERSAGRRPGAEPTKNGAAQTPLALGHSVMKGAGHAVTASRVGAFRRVADNSRRYRSLPAGVRRRSTKTTSPVETA